MDFTGLAKAFESSGAVMEQEAPQEQPVQEVTEPVVQNEQEPVVQDNIVQNEQQPVQAAVKEPINDFPADKFGGKFNSWDEVNDFINKPSEPSFKDNFIKKIVDTYNSNGNLEPFFKAYSVNWENMSTDEVMKKKFFEENSEFDPKIVEKMWNKEVAKFDPDELDEDELEIYKAKRESEASKYRQAKLSEREQYLQPKQQEQTVDLESLRKTVNNLPEIKNLTEKGKLVYQTPDGEFAFKVNDVNAIAESIVDVNSFLNGFVENGKPNAQKWIDVAAYAQNPDQMRQSWVDFGKSLGRKELEQDLKNPSTSNPQPQNQGYSSFEEGLANEFAKKQ